MAIGFRDHMTPRIESLGFNNFHVLGFNNFRAGNHTISVQASEYHYCEPKVTGLSLESYTKFEVAIWRTPTGDVGISEMCPHDLPFEWVSKFEPHYDGDSCVSVAGLVDSDTVYQIVYDLCDAGVTENV